MDHPGTHNHSARDLATEYRKVSTSLDKEIQQCGLGLLTILNKYSDLCKTSRQLLEHVVELEHEQLTLHRKIDAKDAAIENLKEKVKKQQQKLKEWNEYSARAANSRSGADG